jgi:hypothetical protein
MVVGVDSLRGTELEKGSDAVIVENFADDLLLDFTLFCHDGIRW